LVREVQGGSRLREVQGGSRLREVQQGGSRARSSVGLRAEGCTGWRGSLEGVEGQAPGDSRLRVVV
jgi:hypothetical protein